MATDTIVAGAMSSLNVALICTLVSTRVARLAGTVSNTVGRVVSGVTPVVNVHTNLLGSALPLASVAAVVIVAVHTLLAGRLGDDGSVSVARLPTAR